MPLHSRAGWRLRWALPGIVPSAFTLQERGEWLAYRERTCAYFRVHHAGGSIARWLGAPCMMDTTARRASKLRFFAMDR